MASTKYKEPKRVYFVASLNIYCEDGWQYKGPYAMKRPLKEGEKLVCYNLVKVED